MKNKIELITDKQNMQNKILVISSSLFLVLLVMSIIGMYSEDSLISAQDDVGGPSTEASVDYFLKLDGIEGESTDDKHKNEIEVMSFSWGEENKASGKVQMQDFHFVAKTNKASPMLMLATAKGEHFKEAKLTVRKAGGDQQEYLIIKLTDVIVSSYQIEGSSIPTDSFSLNFAKIEFEYYPQKDDGSLGSPTTGIWDFSKNK